MSIFKTRENKKYNYQPRYYKSDGQSPFKVQRKFDEFRSTLDTPKGLKGKFQKAMDDYKNNDDKSSNKRVLIIALILFFIFLALIGFDFSIFLKR